MIKNILLLTGKAKQVFRFVELIAKAHPDKTLGEMLAGENDHAVR